MNDRGFYNSVMDVLPISCFSKRSINLVSGLPRSGTSMMMQILNSGGLQPLTDGYRKADSRNPNGYLEFEDVKNPKSYDSWIDQAPDKSLKVISRFVPHFPATHFYNVIFMTRNLDQVVRSQKDMSEFYSGLPLDDETDGDLKVAYETHLEAILFWIKCRPNFRLCTVHYEDVIEDPNGQLGVVCDFLPWLDLDLAAMTQQVGPAIVRQN